MIHLFGKIYLAPEELMDINYDRVVISNQYGVDVYKKYDDISGGTLLDFGSSLTSILEKYQGSFIDFIDFLHTKSNEKDSRIIIFADDITFKHVLSHWWKLTLPNLSDEQANAMYNSKAFKFNVFNGGTKHSLSSGWPVAMPLEDIRPYFNSVRRYPTTVQSNELFKKIKGTFGVEFMLASYLYDGSYKDELKNVVLKLYKKSLEILLTDLKEMFFASATQEGFTKAMDLEKAYTMSNIQDIIHDNSETAKLFMSPRLWHSPWIRLPSSSSDDGNIILENLTQEHCYKFKQIITKFCELSLGDTMWNNAMNPNDIALNFIRIFKNFDDEALDQILKTDYEIESSQNSIFPINLETVNCYLIQEIYRNHYTNPNPEFIKQFTLRQ